MAPARGQRPWRDNVEAVTMALVVAVLFKYFLVEAYKIPTGSMQPTLFGWKDARGGGVFDRILVDKASYHGRDPARFEVVVFRYPLDRSKNFVKRVWGLPGDHVQIEHGDVWQRRGEDEPWRVLRRPEPVQRSTWLELDHAGRWSFGPREGIWRTEARGLVATAAGAASFPEGTGSVRDLYTDGYPPRLAELVEEQRDLPGGERDVGDLRVEARVVATATCEEARLLLREGTRRYTARLPGPAAAPDARPELVVSDSSHRIDPARVVAEGPLALAPGRGLQVSLENLDDRVTLRLADLVLAVDVPPARDQRAGIALSCRGGGAAFRDLRIHRDVYYRSSGVARSSWRVPDGHYLVLGDNTLDSADGREWQMGGYRVDAPSHGYDDVELLGDTSVDGNPVHVYPLKSEPLTVFRDRFGERHVFPRLNAEPLDPVPAPYVPRELIGGRALLVFWPYVPRLDVYRLRWIR